MQTKDQDLSMADVYGSDPLAKLLIGRWKIKPTIFALIIFFWGIIFLVLLPAIFGYLFPSKGIIRSSIVDRYNQINFLIIFPSLAYYYVAQSKIIIRLYKVISKYVPVLGDQAISTNSYIWMQNAKKYWAIPGMLFAILGMILGTYDNAFNKLGTFWYSANWFMLILMQLTRGIVFYILITVAIRHLVASIGLNKIFEQTEAPLVFTSIKQNTLFQAVNKYAFSFASIVAIVGLALGLQPILSNPPIPEYYIFVAVYFILAPVSFFLPIWQIHKEMVNNKGKILEDLNTKLQSEYKEFLESFEEKNDAAIKKSEEISTRLQLIHQAIVMAEECPNWPFNVNTMYRLGVTIVSPFFLTIINRISEFGNQLFDSLIN